MPKSTNFGAFAKALTKGWFKGMSGPAAVPLTIIGCLTSTPWLKVILFLTAITCVVFASYQAWRVEREQVIVLEEKQRPKLKVEAKDYLDDLTGEGPLIVLAIQSSCMQPLLNCRGRVTSIEKDGRGTFGPSNLPLHFVSILKNQESVDLAPGAMEYLKVLLVGITDDLSLCASTGQLRKHSVFPTQGEYFITILISADNTPSKKIKLLFDWELDLKSKYLVVSEEDISP